MRPLNVIHNFPLISALIAIFIAQFIKVPIHYISRRTINIQLAFSTGGMPSSHSAAVAALATAVGMMDGFSSTTFAIALMVSIITMYDAAGIRRHAGMHASALNRMTKTISVLHNKEQVDPSLKEMLGHRPIEVCAGASLGIAVSLIMKLMLY
ncbi:divergent PAP2 family protein [Paenibacillus solisilvae]|uniref:Divergent PAP2 family protein n=1 Tax=Paenibacillus solisilvae TaxID=2486751 RepID=A0ABW0VXN0_9BACL